MAYSPEQWEKTKAYFESGQYSLSQISEKTGISKSKISERAKRELWERGRNADYIEARTTLAIKKGTEKGTTIQVLDDIADEAIRNKNLVHGVTQKALRRLDELASVAEDPNDLKIIIEASDRASLTLGVNPRHASNQVNIQNNQSVEPVKIIREIIDVRAND